MVDFVGAQIDQFVYSLYEQGATLFWLIVKAFLYAAYFLMELTAWVTGSVLSPLIGTTFEITGGLLGPIVLIASILLAIGYFLSVWGDFQIVDFKKGFMWLLISVFVFSVGPTFYEGIESFRRGLGEVFYQNGLAQVSDAAASIGGLDNFDSDDSIYMEPVINYLGIYGFSSTDKWIDGIDVVFAFTQSDGCDLFRASSCVPQSGIWVSCSALSLHPCMLPTKWYAGPEPYFDVSHTATGFPYMTPEERQAAIADASQGLMVVVTALPMALFALIEQVINFLLALSMGVGYLSLGIAVLFSFFKRTEAITWAVVNLIIELFIQSIMSSLYLSLIVTLLIVAAGIGNGILVIGTALIGIVLLGVLLVSAWNALWSAINRMFGAMSAVTGNNMPQVTKVAGDMAGSLTGAATGAAGAGAVLMRGGSLAQAAGLAFSGNQGFTNAARNASFLFGEDTGIGQMATEAYQGAAAGGLFGKVIGAAVLPVGEDEEDGDGASSGRRRRYFDDDGNPYPSRGGGGGNGGSGDAPDDSGSGDAVESRPAPNNKIQTSGDLKSRSIEGDWVDADSGRSYLGRSQLPAAFRLDAIDNVEFQDGMMPDNLYGGSLVKRDDLKSFTTKDGIAYSADSEAPQNPDLEDGGNFMKAEEWNEPWRRKQRDFGQEAAGLSTEMAMTRTNWTSDTDEDSSEEMDEAASLERWVADTRQADLLGEMPPPRPVPAAPVPQAPEMPDYLKDAPDFDHESSAASSYEPPASMPLSSDDLMKIDASDDGETRAEVGQALAAMNNAPVVNIDLSALTTAIGSLMRVPEMNMAENSPVGDFANLASGMGVSEANARQVITDVANTGEIQPATRLAAFSDMAGAASGPLPMSASLGMMGQLESSAQQVVTSLQNTANKIGSVNPVSAVSSVAPAPSAAAPIVGAVVGAPSADVGSDSSESSAPRHKRVGSRRRKNPATDGAPDA